MNRPLRVIVGGVGVCTLLSAAAVGVLAIVGAERVAWFLLMFEAVALVGALMAVLAALGKFRASPALAVACAAMTVLLASIMGERSSRTSFTLFDLRVLTLARVAATGVLGLGAAWIVLGRAPGRTLRPLAMGVGLGVAAMGIPVAAWMAWGRIGAPLVAVAVFLVVTALLSAAVHLTMRAFEIGDSAGPEPATPDSGFVMKRSAAPGAG